MGRFRYNLSDHKTRKAHVAAVREQFAEQIAAKRALDETFDPEAAKITDDPFPEEIKSDSTEAPVSADAEMVAEEETPMPVRKCSVCREPGHTKRDCPTLAAKSPEEGTVSESNTGDAEQ